MARPSYELSGCDVEYLSNGNAVPQGANPKHKIIIGPHGCSDGYALTPNIPKDFWDLWF